MKINFKYFNISSIRCEFKLKYNQNKVVKFNNHFIDFDRAKKGIESFKNHIRDIQKKSYDSLISFANTKKHWAQKQSNEEIEPSLFVMMKYGYNRDFIINKIFEGYQSENIGTENEVKEKLIGSNNWILKSVLSIDEHSSHKERLISLVKNKTLYPLFVDSNHSLYHGNPQKVVSKEKIESLFKEIFLSFNSLAL